MYRVHMCFPHGGIISQDFAFRDSADKFFEKCFASNLAYDFQRIFIVDVEDGSVLRQREGEGHV